jgi:hypothetical protein
MAVVPPLNNFMGPEGDTVTVAEQLLNTEYCNSQGNLCPVAYYSCSLSPIERLRLRRTAGDELEGRDALYQDGSLRRGKTTDRESWQCPY